MRRTTRFGWLGIAAATAILAAGCGGGSGRGGPDADADVPDGMTLEVPDGEMPTDAPRPDVPPVDAPDGPGDAPDEGTADLPTDAEGDAPDAVTPCDAAVATARGKDWLEKAEPGFARNAFDEALAACPDDANARFGAALAEMIYGGELFVSALSVATGQGTGPNLAAPPPRDDDGDASQNEILARQFHGVMLSLRSHFAKGLEHLEALGDRDVDFRVTGVGVYLGIHPNLMFHGRFDKGDVLLMRAVGSLLTGIFDVLAGQDFNTDVLSVISLVRNGIDGKVDFVWISRFVAYLLIEDARFLAIHPEDGAMLFADARKRLSDVGPLLDAALAEIRRQGTDGDHVSFVEDLAAGTVLNVQSRVRLDDDETPFEEPWYLILSEPTLQAFRDASHGILTPGEAVTLHGAVLPVLATVLVGFVRVDLLDILGIELPGGLDIAALEVDDLVGVLKALMPNVMAFDWGTFFETPVGLRAWLPAVTTDLPLMQNTILASWECPDDLVTDGFPHGALRLLCKDGVALVDGPHFAGTLYPTEADGIPSAFPVLAFPDPTLHGLAQVDLAGKDGNTDASTYSPATGTTLNAALARLLAGVLTLIN